MGKTCASKIVGENTKAILVVWRKQSGGSEGHHALVAKSSWSAGSWLAAKADRFLPCLRPGKKSKMVLMPRGTALLSIHRDEGPTLWISGWRSMKKTLASPLLHHQRPAAQLNHGPGWMISHPAQQLPALFLLLMPTLQLQSAIEFFPATEQAVSELA